MTHSFPQIAQPSRYKYQFTGNAEIEEHVKCHSSDTLVRYSPSGIQQGKWNNSKQQQKSKKIGEWSCTLKHD